MSEKLDEINVDNLIRNIILNQSTSFGKRGVSLKVRDELEKINVNLKLDEIEQKVFKQICLLENDEKIYLKDSVYKLKQHSML